MRTFWIITLVLVTVLVMATAASASVRDSVASLVGDRTGAAEGSGDGGTFTVTAVKSGEPEPSEDAWSIKNGETTAPEGGTYVFRSNTVTEPAEVEPAGQADRDADFNGEEIAPVGPDAQVQPEEPVDAETATKKGKGKATTE
jgi:hypothetical protein